MTGLLLVPDDEVAVPNVMAAVVDVGHLALGGPPHVPLPGRERQVWGRPGGRGAGLEGYRCRGLKYPKP